MKKLEVDFFVVFFSPYAVPSQHDDMDRSLGTEY